jgi:hypothetical protein
MGVLRNNIVKYLRVAVAICFVLNCVILGPAMFKFSLASKNPGSRSRHPPSSALRRAARLSGATRAFSNSALIVSSYSILLHPLRVIFYLYQTLSLILAESFDACPILYIGYDMYLMFEIGMIDQIMRYLMVVVL